MATSVIPQVIDALYEQATALNAFTVFDGPGVDLAPDNDYLMVGVANPDTPDEIDAADSQQTWAHANHTARDEVGVVLCTALSFRGNAVMKDARDGAFAISNAVEQLLRDNPSLGLANVLWTGFGQQIRLMTNQSMNGAVAAVSFHVEFRARI